MDGRHEGKAFWCFLPLTVDNRDSHYLAFRNVMGDHEEGQYQVLERDTLVVPRELLVYMGSVPYGQSNVSV
jgi:hypothetical protein